MWNRHNGFVLHSCSRHVPIFTVLLFEGKPAENIRLHRDFSLSKYVMVSILRDFDCRWDKIEVRVVSWDGTKPGKVATSLFLLLLFP